MSAADVAKTSQPEWFWRQFSEMFALGLIDVFPCENDKLDPATVQSIELSAYGHALAARLKSE
jgi:hypothetical protein